MLAVLQITSDGKWRGKVMNTRGFLSASHIFKQKNTHSQKCVFLIGFIWPLLIQLEHTALIHFYDRCNENLECVFFFLSLFECFQIRVNLLGDPDFSLEL